MFILIGKFLPHDAIKRSQQTFPPQAGLKRVGHVSKFFDGPGEDRHKQNTNTRHLWFSLPSRDKSMNSAFFPRAVFAFCLAFIASTASAASDINTGFFGSTAIKGYDAVAYHTEQKPVKGRKKHAYEWMNAKWLFATEANRTAFAANPEKYAPQYGGYCAYAVSQGYTAGIDPEAFYLLGGKLYLNYSPDIQKQWLENRDQFIKDADKNWPEVLD